MADYDGEYPEFDDDYIEADDSDGELEPAFEDEQFGEVEDTVEFVTEDIPPMATIGAENAAWVRWVNDRVSGLSTSQPILRGQIDSLTLAHEGTASLVADQGEQLAETADLTAVHDSVLTSTAPPARPTAPTLTTGLGVVVADWDGMLLQLGTDGIMSPRPPENGFREVFAEVSFTEPTDPPADPDDFPDGPDDVEGPDDDTGFVEDGGVVGEDNGSVEGEDDGDEQNIPDTDDDGDAPVADENPWDDPTPWVRMGTSLTQDGSIPIKATPGDVIWVRLVAIDYYNRRSEGSDFVQITVLGVELPDLEAEVDAYIQSAIDAAEAAQTTADGKNRIIVSTTEPAGTDYAQGDQWWIRNATEAGQLDGVKVWNGTAWVNYQIVADSIIVPGTVDDTIIADGAIKTTKLDAGAVTAEKIAAGTITANEIAAGTITGTELSADAIDGKTITGALIRTAASGQRLQLDSSGLRAFDSLGGETARLSAASGGLSLTGPILSDNGTYSTEMGSGETRFYYGATLVGSIRANAILNPPMPPELYFMIGSSTRGLHIGGSASYPVVLKGNGTRVETKLLVQGPLTYSMDDLGTNDLNILLGSGSQTYSQNSGANATTARHYPVARAGVLEHTENSAGTNAFQRYTTVATNNVYTRSYNAGAWTGWLLTTTQAGQESMNLVANTNVTKTVSFAAETFPSNNIVVQLTGRSGSPDVLGAPTVSAVSASGFTINWRRTTTATTSIDWTATHF